ncbi:MAG TPA: TIGR03943 family protein [Micromonosporaceae bacterium]|nr:TIGR03943 family protein [Micromonosporaceae bacterium]HCU51625.1 TIGR03943 family protein [Micromonosporaceae bacterium]
MNRQAQGVVLLLLGGAVLKATVFTEIYLRYVKESLLPFLIGAGVMLVIAGVMTIIYDLRHGSETDTECAEGEDHGHEHATPHHEPRVGWMLIAPVLGLLLVAPPALGAFAAGQSGSAVLIEADLYPPLPDGDPAKISVLDYATRAIFDKGKSMKDGGGGNRKVQISGFLSEGPAGEKVLTRMMLSCCAADARPIKIGMAGQTPAGIANDQWVEVTGVYTTKTVKDPVNNNDIPFIEVLEWRQIEPPRNQYE